MKYEEFVEKLKTGHVYTHGGGMHADDVCAMALINLVCDKEGIERPEVHRVFKVEDAQQFEKEGNIVFDIGFGEFDHHQPDNAVRENGIPYAAFGKIYDVVGKEVFGDQAEEFERSFVEVIDKCDNSEETCEFSSMIHLMVPNWDEALTTDEAFQNAVRITEQGIKERVEELGMVEHSFESGQPEIRDLTNLISSLEQEIFETRGEEKEAAIAKASELIQGAISSAKVYAAGDMEYGLMEFDKPGIPYTAIKEQVDEFNAENEDRQIIGYTFPARDQLTFKPIGIEPVKRFQEGNLDEIDGLTFYHPAGISMSCVNDESMFNAVEVLLAENLEVDRSEIVRTWMPNSGGTSQEEQIDEQEEDTTLE